MPATHRAPGAVEIIEPPQRLDAASAPARRELIGAQVARGRTCLVFDLSAVDFSDSSRLSVLVTGLNTARAAGGDSALLRLSPVMQRMIELTRLHQSLVIFDDVDAAALGAPPA